MTSPTEPRHPIQVVALRSGLSADVLRAWEKRYQVVEPARAARGRRLYSDEDIARLTLLREALEGGRRIGDVAALGAAELRELVEADRAAAAAPLSAPATQLEGRAGERRYPDFVDEALRAVRAYDARSLRAMLERAAVLEDPQTLIERYVAPLMVAIGEQWVRGQLNPGQEHLATVVVRRVVEDLFLSLQPPTGGPRLVVATSQGQRHELGALLAAAVAGLEGWRVTYLGADLPISEIAGAVLSTGAHAVALSVTISDARLTADLAELRSRLGDDRPILVGGQSAEQAADARQRIVRLTNISSLRTVLRSLREAAAEGSSAAL